MYKIINRIVTAMILNWLMNFSELTYKTTLFGCILLYFITYALGQVRFT